MSSPGLLLSTFAVEIVKPEPAVALGCPLEPIDGWQPSEFDFAVQYVTGPSGIAVIAPRISPSGCDATCTLSHALPLAIACETLAGTTSRSVMNMWLYGSIGW